MRKLKLIKPNEVAITKGASIECDFCGDRDKTVFTSSYDDFDDNSRNESQICLDCVKQLSKLI